MTRTGAGRKLDCGMSERDEFLYREAEFAGGAIRLLPGVPAAFRALYRLVLDAVRGAWLRQVSDIAANRPLLGASCVDHFIAWSRYPVGLGHNLVLAHETCNAKKRDFLAYPAHVERWRLSHLERASELGERFDSLSLPHDPARSRAIAWWAYEQGEAAGAHAWIDAERFVRLDSSWRDVLGDGNLRRVAEPAPAGYRPV